MYDNLWQLPTLFAAHLTVQVLVAAASSVFIIRQSWNATTRLCRLCCTQPATSCDLLLLLLLGVGSLAALKPCRGFSTQSSFRRSKLDPL